MFITATGLEITPIERKKYMVLWKQFLLNTTWIDSLDVENNGIVTIIGNDLGKLNQAIKSWDFTLDATTLKIVVAISARASMEPRSHIKKQDILDAFDVAVAWDEVPILDDNALFPYQSHTSPNDVQICVLSIREGECADLSSLWSIALSQQQSTLAPYIDLHTSWPCQMDLWQTEWQELKKDDQDFRYNPTHMHYSIEVDDVESYRPRISASLGRYWGICNVNIMRNYRMA